MPELRSVWSRASLILLLSVLGCRGHGGKTGPGDLADPCSFLTDDEVNAAARTVMMNP